MCVEYVASREDDISYVPPFLKKKLKKICRDFLEEILVVLERTHNIYRQIIDNCVVMKF